MSFGAACELICRLPVLFAFLATQMQEGLAFWIHVDGLVLILVIYVHHFNLIQSADPLAQFFVFLAALTLFIFEMQEEHFPCVAFFLGL